MKHGVNHNDKYYGRGDIYYYWGVIIIMVIFLVFTHSLSIFIINITTGWHDYQYCYDYYIMRFPAPLFQWEPVSQSVFWWSFGGSSDTTPATYGLKGSDLVLDLHKSLLPSKDSFSLINLNIQNARDARGVCPRHQYERYFRKSVFRNPCSECSGAPLFVQITPWNGILAQNDH